MPNIFYGWWIIIACFILSLYSGGIVFYGFTAFFDPLVKEFGWSYAQISFALSIRGIEMSFLSPVIGFLVDRHGPRKMAFLGVFTIGIGFFLLSQTRALWMFYGSFILIAFGAGGCASVVFMRVTTNWFRRKIGLALGLLSSGFGASGLVVPLVVYLIDTTGWRTAVILLGAGMWLIGFPLVWLIRDTPESCGLCPDGLKIETPAAGGPAGDEGDEMGFREALRHRAFIILVLSEAIRMVAVGAVVTHIVPYLSAIQVPRSTAGIIAGLIVLLSTPGRFVFGWLSDRFDKRKTMIIAFTMMSLGLFALCHVQNPGIMILFLILFPVGMGATVVLRGAFLRDYFGRQAFGRLLGLVMGGAAAGSMIGPILAGLIFDELGRYDIAWYLLGALSLLSVGLMAFVGPRPRGRRP
jgi:MFS family permease